jgi:UDP-N-acetylmuramoylalanine--D-glutamate ligase
MGAEVRVTEASDNYAVKKNAKKLAQKGIACEIGVHTKDFISGSTLIVISPGVEDSSIAVKWANELKIPIISEMELGYRYCKGKIIAITGTNGKSTVTTLIGEMLENAGLDVVVCGNIGNSLCGEIKHIQSETYVVLEVSSFQLERIVDFRPYIAIILNVTDDHMDRYSKFGDYFSEKLKIFKNQRKGDILILNRDAKELEGVEGLAGSMVLYYSRFSKTNGAYLKGNALVCDLNGSEIEICMVNDVRLKGLHNVENVLVSSLAAVIAGAKPSFIKSTVKTFKGLSHRFETVDTIDGVEYIDDSKGTTVDSTYRALESCSRPVILIAGGKDKNSDYAVIKDMVRSKVKYLILIGEARKRIREAIGDIVETHEADTMKDAVELASRLAKDNYMVLLSPMCSSFDMFKDYKERGEIFKKAVLSIK